MSTTNPYVGSGADASDWMLIDSATTIWPTGNGGSTATNTSSILAADANSILDSIEVLTAHSAGTTITIYRHDGTTVVRTISIAANQACPLYVPLGGPGGVKRGAGLSAKTSNTATTANMNFRGGA
jgi:hypothetical protein